MVPLGGINSPLANMLLAEGCSAGLRARGYTIANFFSMGWLCDTVFGAADALSHAWLSVGLICLLYALCFYLYLSFSP
jgi:hypothetical protein